MALKDNVAGKIQDLQDALAAEQAEFLRRKAEILARIAVLTKYQNTNIDDVVAALKQERLL